MWFKNALVFQLTRRKFFPQIALEEALKEMVYRPCGANELGSFGWVSALPDTENLVHGIENNNFMLLRVMKEEKVIVKDAIEKPLKEKVKAIEKSEARRVGKKEKEQFKEDIVFELLPSAQSKYKETLLYIDVKNELIVINSSSRPHAEDILALLRRCLGTLPVTKYIDSYLLQQRLKVWLSEPHDTPEAFTIGYDTSLSSLDDDCGRVIFKNEELNTPFVKELLEEGRDVEYLKVDFYESFGLVFKDDGCIKNINFYDVLTEQNEDIDAEDILARIDADFTLFANEMSRFFLTLSELKLTEEIKKEEYVPPASIEKIEIIDSKQEKADAA